MHNHQRTQHIRTHIEAPGLQPVEINRNPQAYENFSFEKPTTRAHATKMIVHWFKTSDRRNYMLDSQKVVIVCGGILLASIIIGITWNFSIKAKKNLK